MKHGFAIGIDIGGTHSKLGVVDASGAVHHGWKMPTEAHGSSPELYLNQLVREIQTLLKRVDGDIVGFGVSMHGHLDHERRGPILCNNTPALRGLDMKGFLHERFGYPVIINNDLTAHALAEYHFGSGQGSRRFLCLAIGTGLGVGLIADGEPIRFVEGTPGDVGRLVLDPSGPEDVYGVCGSAEILCGVPGIERLAKEYYGTSRRAFEVIAAARAGDEPIAQEIMRQIGTYLGQTLALVCPIYLPDRISLTGGTTEAGQVLLTACRKRFAQLLSGYYQHISQLAPEYYRKPEITLGTMRGEAGLVGAVVEFFRP